MILMIVATIIEKGTVKEFINPREAPRTRKKILKMNVAMSVTAMDGRSIALAENGRNKNADFYGL